MERYFHTSVDSHLSSVTNLETRSTTWHRLVHGGTRMLLAESTHKKAEYNEAVHGKGDQKLNDWIQK